MECSFSLLVEYAMPPGITSTYLPLWTAAPSTEIMSGNSLALATLAARCQTKLLQG